MNNSVAYATLMLLAGMGIPTMAAINSGLGEKLQSPSLASAILLLFGSSVVVAYLLMTEGLPELFITNNIPAYFYLGGFFIAFYILTVTTIAPRFGIANAISFVLLGQLIAMTLIDHYGWLGALQVTANQQRLLGIACMVLGVFLVLKRPAA